MITGLVGMDRDPGYSGTARLVAESAICLALDVRDRDRRDRETETETATRRDRVDEICTHPGHTEAVFTQRTTIV